MKEETGAVLRRVADLVVVWLQEADSDDDDDDDDDDDYCRRQRRQ